MYISTSYILVIIGALLCMGASAYVNAVYKKYSQVPSMSGLTGAQVAQKILKMSDTEYVRINHIQGSLSDHYDPKNMQVNLSDSVYGSASVAAIAVAAHECGHVMQHKEEYLPIKLRTALVPIANIGSRLGLPMIIIGIFLGNMYGRAYANAYYGGTMGIGHLIATIGIWAFALGVAFQIVTLPVEFNASRRALKMLDEYGILGQSELSEGAKVLRAAALTYVAAAASSILQLLRLMAIVGGGGRRRR